MKYNLGRFENSIGEFGIVLDDMKREQFVRFYELLIEWNSFMNLTAITEFEDVVVKHFVDSLSIMKVMKLENQSVIDLGTGAGFPGIPIKIVFPDVKLTLADSLQKRVMFLNQVILDLELKDIKTVHGRAEDLARQKEYREQFDVCVSRAVANLATLSEYCLPFVKCGGVFVSYKADTAEQEMKDAEKAIEMCGGIIRRNESFMLPNTEYGRTLVYISKNKETDNRFPRKAGLPSKEPLL